MAYEAKSSKVQSRQLKVQTLSIPFDITYHATPASVVHTNDEPSVLFINTEGNAKITAKVSALGDTATYTTGATDSTGDVNFFISLGGEVCEKVVSAMVIERDNGAVQPCYVGSTGSGISTLGNIMLHMNSATDLGATSMAGVLIVKYVVAE